MRVPATITKRETTRGIGKQNSSLSGAVLLADVQSALFLVFNYFFLFTSSNRDFLRLGLRLLG